MNNNDKKKLLIGLSILLLGAAILYIFPHYSFQNNLVLSLVFLFAISAFMKLGKDLNQTTADKKQTEKNEFSLINFYNQPISRKTYTIPVIIIWILCLVIFITFNLNNLLFYLILIIYLLSLWSLEFKRLLDVTSRKKAFYLILIPIVVYFCGLITDFVPETSFSTIISYGVGIIDIIFMITLMFIPRKK